VGNDRKGATAAGFGGEGQSGGFQGGGAVRAKWAILGKLHPCSGPRWV
jgi:hypothetical protein